MNKIASLRKRLQRFRAKRATTQRQGVPRITNDTVAEHREQVLSTARKYIYPLQQSRHRIVVLSVAIFVAVVLAFLTYTLLALYRFNTTSTVMYRVTQIIPFPIARAGSSVVSYENYLFELRRYMHYYSTQQEVDFSGEAGAAQLKEFRKRALENVIDAAFVRQLANEQGVSVSRKEIDQQIDLLRSQNRLGGNDQVFEDVLREFWNWSIEDFRRELSKQLLAQKVASKLDAEAHAEAKTVHDQLLAGGDFAALAKEHSDDVSTKEQGGDYGVAIERTNRDIQPQVIEALFKLEKDQVSPVIETPLGLEVLKVTEKTETSVRASHIVIAFKNIDTHIQPLKESKTVWRFIRP